MNFPRGYGQGATIYVSIPFRADTGFEHHNQVNHVHALDVSIPFRADTGFELLTSCRTSRLITFVSIPFRADTGFELTICKNWFDKSQKLFQSLSGLTLGLNWPTSDCATSRGMLFQSLSGLTLGLNHCIHLLYTGKGGVSIPFRADTGFEREKHGRRRITV